MNRQAGPPPVQQRAVQTVDATYGKVRQIVGTDATVRAVQAMFANDETLARRFLSVAMSQLAKNGDVLSRATPLSVVQAIKDAAALGLELDGQEAALVQHSGVASVMPMWRGYLKRIRNSGLVQSVDSLIVRDLDTFSYGANESGAWFTFAPYMGQRQADGSMSDAGGYAYAIAWATMTSGYKYLEVMTEAEVNRVRDTHGRTHTQTGKPLPWATDWSEMARKTVIRRLAKRLPVAAVSELLVADARIDEATDKTVASVSSAAAQADRELRRAAMEAVSVPRLEMPPEPEKRPQTPDTAPGDEIMQGRGGDPSVGASPEVASDPPAPPTKRQLVEMDRDELDAWTEAAAAADYSRTKEQIDLESAMRLVEQERKRR